MDDNVDSRYGLSRQSNVVLRMGRKGYVMESCMGRLYLNAYRADMAFKRDKVE